jgi:hypothetical protein
VSRSDSPAPEPSGASFVLRRLDYP